MKTHDAMVALLAAGLTGLLTVTAQAQYPNPVVDASGRYVTGQTYDPWTNNVTVHTNQDIYRQSYFDPNRNNADPGSVQYVNRWVQDQNGNWVREHGWTWTTNGVPHGNLTRSSPPQQVVPSTTYPSYPSSVGVQYWPTPGVLQQQNTTTMFYGRPPGMNYQGNSTMHYSAGPGVSHQGNTTMYFAPGSGGQRPGNNAAPMPYQGGRR